MTVAHGYGLTRRYHAELVILIAVTVLLAFYYFARADTIGVSSAQHGWSAMTKPALPGLLYFPVAALLLAVIPVWAVRRMTGLSLAELGLGLGDWRRGLALVAVGMPLAVLAAWIGARAPAMRAVYPLISPAVAPHGFPGYALLEFFYYAAWEVLFRGVLLFGLRPRLGEGPANVVQTGLSVTAHFGRAINETASALPFGLLFGWIDLRLRSVWYLAIVHWTVGVSMDWFCTSGV